MDTDFLREWLGRTEAHTDQVTPTPIAALAATLDRADPPPAQGDVLPPLWHWLYFLPIHRLSESGPDGHPKRGGFLPPVPLPRRMWAGSRIQFHQPLRVGDAIARVSQITDVSHKSGRSGDLVFVQVKHTLSNPQGLALSEEQNIVYRDNPRPDDPVVPPISAPEAHDWSREIHPSDVLLFRYSALTFNSHRIHYDRRYVTEVEGYPGLVVHGPLVATLLLDLVRQELPGAELKEFSFRAVRPIYDTASFSVCGRVEADGKTIKLWGKDAQGWLTTDARALIA